MSVESDLFRISVIGPKARVTRMLNEAIRQEGAGDLIAEGDDIETINRKLFGKDGKPGLMVVYGQLIDEKCLEEDMVINDKWRAAVEKHKQKVASGEPMDDEYESRVELFKVEEYAPGTYEVKFSSYVSECESYGNCIDWVDWEDIARVYQCRIYVDDDYYRNGVFMRFECATIYEPSEGGVKRTHLESGTTREEYDEFMDKLVELCPERYLPLREDYLKEKEEMMAYQREMKRLEEKYHLIEPMHNKTWDSFTAAEEKGPDSIREVYASCLEQVTRRIAWVDIDGLLQVLVVRAEELKGVNDKLAHGYVDLLRSFRGDYDKKVKELKVEYPESTIFIEITPEAWEEQYPWLECYPYEHYQPEWRKRRMNLEEETEDDGSWIDAILNGSDERSEEPGGKEDENLYTIYETIKDKALFSNISGEMAEVVEKLPKEIVPGKVLFDGMMLFDGIEGIEDDIQQMHAYTKDGDIVNLEDYYTDNGAFEDGGRDRFLAALDRLMTRDEFLSNNA